eukprot:TRINITY_DN1171_c0_g3_i1.p1 TRINITY_DN1171_c0_g3~~TRINITY_DN1171_c0_g3_i1.p1  ORF type:complete len:4247 (+),score=1107.78 TRINITY_DN1171_c0_g3_i1:46-12786(+)
MLEEVVTKLLIKHLGNFVEFNADNLRLSVWKGAVTLRSMQLKSTALDGLHLPIAVRGGVLGKLDLSIPWKNLSSKPTQVIIQDVFVLAGPAGAHQESAEDFAQRRQKDKQKRLQEAEERRHGSEQEDDRTERTFAARLAEKIVANLQFSIRDVHVRYEDAVSDPGKPFAFGITIEQLDAHSTNELWEKVVVEAQAAIVRKKALLQNLSVYWDPLDEPRVWIDANQMGNFMRELIPSEQHPLAHQYILNPVNAELKLTIDRPRGSGTATIKAECVFPALQLGLQEAQYRNLLALLNVFLTHWNRLQSKYRSNRPSRLDKFNPRVWWGFAIKCVLDDVHDRRVRWMKDTITARRHDRLRYVDLFTKKLADDKLKGRDATDMQTLEEKLSFEDIVYFRSLAERARAEHKMMKAAKKLLKKSRFKRLFGSDTEKKPDAISLSREELTKLNDIIDFDPAAEDGGDSRPFLDLSFALEHGTFTLGKTALQPILELLFQGVQVQVRGKTPALQIGVSLQSIIARDSGSTDTKLPMFIQPVRNMQTRRFSVGQTAVVTADPVWRMEVELPREGASMTLRMWLLPLQIVYAKECFERIISFFYLSDLAMVQTLEVAAMERLQRLQSRSKAQLQTVAAEHKRMNLMLDLSAPNLIVPCSCDDENARALVLNLGHLLLRTESAASHAAAGSADSDEFYDRFQLSLTELSAYTCFVRTIANTADSADSADAIDVIVERAGLEMTILNCIAPTEVSLTEVKVSAHVPLVVVNASSERIADIMAVLRAVLAPAKEAVVRNQDAYDFVKEKELAQLQLPLVRDDKLDELVMLLQDQRTPEEIQMMLRRHELELNLTVDSIKGNVLVQNKPIATVVIKSFGLSVVKRTFDTEVQFRVSSLQLDDCSQGSQVLRLAESAPSTELLDLRAVIIEPNSPEFQGKDKSITIRVGPLRIVAYRDTVTRLLEIGIRAALGGIALYNAPRTEGVAGTLVAQRAKPAVRTDDTIELDVNVSNLSLALATTDQIAELQLQRTSVQVLKKPTTIRVKGQVGRIAVTDLNKASLFHEVITIMDEGETVVFAVETFDPGKADCDVDFRLRVASMRAILLPQFINGVRSYFFDGPLIVSLLSLAGREVASKAITAVDQLSQQQEHIKLDVDFAQLQLKLPVDMTRSLNVDIGRIVAKSQLIDSGQNEQISLTITGIGATAADKLVLESTDIKIEMLRPMKGEVSIRVDAELPSLRLLLSTSQYVVLREVATGMMNALPAAAIHPTAPDVDVEALGTAHAAPASIVHLALQFKLHVLSLTVIDDSQHGVAMPLACLQLDEVHSTFLQNTSGRTFQLRLHGLFIDDLLQPTDSPFRKLATSYMGDTADLVSVSFREKATCTPVYTPISRHVDVAFSALTVVATRKTLAMLAQFVLSVPFAPEAATPQAESVAKPVVVSIAVNVVVGPLALILNRDGTPIASVELAHANVDLRALGNELKLRLMLGNVIVNDLTAAADDPFRTIVQCVNTASIVDFSMHQYANPVGLCDGDIVLRTAEIRALVLARFISEIQAYIVDGPLLDVLRLVQTAAPQPSSGAVVTTVAAAAAAAPKHYFKLDIQVGRPMIIVPRHSTATLLDSAVLNCGEISVRSADSDSELSHLVVVNVLHMTLTGGEAQTPIISGIDATVNLHLPLVASAPVLVKGEIPLLEVMFAPQTYELILGLVAGNLSEDPRIAGAVKQTASLPTGKQEEAQALELEFKLGQLSARTVGREGQDLIHLQVNGINASVKQDALSQAVSIRLHGMLIDDLLQASDSEYRSLATSYAASAESTNDLIAIDFVSDLRTQAKTLRCTFYSLWMHINQETVSGLLDLLYAGFMQNMVSHEQSDEAAETGPAPVPQSTLAVTVNVGPLHVSLAQRGLGVARVDLDHMRFALEQRPTSMLAKGSLGKVCIVDLTAAADSNHQAVLSFDGTSHEGTDVVDFSYEEFADTRVCDSELRLRTKAVRVVLMPTFVEGMRSYFMDGPLLRAVLAMSAAKVAESGSQALKKLTPRMKVDVEVACPLIVLPRADVKSRSMCLIDLGNVAVRTAFDQHASVHTVLFTRLNIAVGKSFDDVTRILDEINVKLDISLPFEAIHPKRITGRLSDVTLHMEGDEYEVLLGVFRGFQSTLVLHDDSKEQLWTCSHCAYQSPVFVDQCSLCKTPRPIPPPHLASEVFLRLSDPPVVQEISVLLPSLSARVGDFAGPLAELVVRDVRLGMKGFEDESLQLQLQIFGILLRDVREQASVRVRDLIGPAANVVKMEAPPPQIELRLFLTAGGDTEVTVVIGNLRAYVVSDALTALARFVAPPLVKLMPPPAATPERKTRAVAETALRAKVNLTNVDVVVLRNETNMDDELAPTVHAAVVLQVDEDSNGIVIAVRGSDIRAYVAPPLSQVAVRTLLEPFSFDLDYRYSHTDGQTIDAVVAKLQSCISYQDCALIAAIVSELQIETETLQVDLEAAMRVRAVSAPPPRQVMTPTKMMPKVTELAQSAKIRLEGLSVVLINDRHGANSPFVAAELQDVYATIKGFEQDDLSLELRLQLSASFFNPLRVVWEPLIEPWTATIGIERKAAPKPVMDVRVISDSILNLNASEVFITSLLNTIHVWKGDAASKSSDYSPFWLTNQTGAQMVITLPGARYTADVNQRIAFSPPAPSGRESALTPVACVADLQMDDATALQVPLDRAGTRVWSTGSKWIVCEVAHIRGSRLVRIMSPVVVANHCAEPVVIQMMEIRMLAAPESTTGIPLAYVSDELQLRFRPAEGDDSMFSNPLTPVRANVGRYKAQCGNTFYVVGVSDMAYPGKPTVRAHVVISLRPPWIVENLTYAPLEFDMRLRDGRVAYSGSITSGDRVGIHTVDVSAEFSFRLRPAGFNWSEPAVPEDGTRSCRVRGAQGVLLLCLEIGVDGETGTRVIRIYTPLTVVNRTGRPLSLRSASSLIRIAANAKSSTLSDDAEVTDFAGVPTEFEDVVLPSHLFIVEAAYGRLNINKCKDVTTILQGSVAKGKLTLLPQSKDAIFGVTGSLFHKSTLRVQYVVNDHRIIRTFGERDGFSLPFPGDATLLSETGRLQIVQAIYGVLDTTNKIVDVTSELIALQGPANRITISCKDKDDIPGFVDPAAVQRKHLRVCFNWRRASYVRIWNDQDDISFPCEADIRPWFPMNCPPLRIIKAEYGVLNSRHCMDVTQQIKAMVGADCSRLSLPAASKNLLCGFSDPAFLHQKQFAIVYAVGDGPAIRDVFREDDAIDIPSDDAMALVVSQDCEVDTSDAVRGMISADDGRLILRVGPSLWSAPIPVNAVGSNGSFQVRDVARMGQPTGSYNVAVTVALDDGKFRRTRVVTISNQFMLQNRTNRGLLIRQKDTHRDFALLPGGKRPFHWTNVDKPPLVCVKFEDGGYFSGGFDMNVLEEFELLLRRRGAPPEFLRVSISSDGATCVVTFAEADSRHPPYRLSNKLSDRITISQKDVETWDSVPSGAIISVSWDEPRMPHLLRVRVGDREPLMEVPLDEVGESAPFDLGQGRVVRYDVKADGPTRVITLSENNDQTSVVAQPGGPRVQLALSVNLVGLAVSVIEQTPRELLYISLSDMKVSAIVSAVDQQFGVTVGDLQVDNQMHVCRFPVILAPAPKDQQRVLLEVGVARDTEHENIDFFRYASVLMQEIDVKVEADLIVAIVALVRRIMTEADTLFDSKDEAETLPTAKRVYFELLHLQPVKANITFTSGAQSLNEDPSIGSVLRAVGVNFANIDNAPLRLNSLALEHLFGTRELLITKMAAHYKRQGLAELYKVLGSLDVVGNPIGLFDSISTGVMDFFYEPARGAVTSPQAFGRGLAKGSLSLVKNSVFGVMNAGTRITGTIGKGVAALSFDKDYLAERERESRSIPTDALDGLGLGSVALARGLFDGVTGLVLQPIQGARAEGALGLMKGIGRGIVGTVVKPVAGVLDLTSKTLEGVRNTTTIFDYKRDRMRVPRSFAADGSLRVYHFPTERLCYLHDGAFRNDKYVFDATVDGEKLCIVSDRRLIVASENTRADWTVPLEDIEQAGVSDMHVIVQLTMAARRRNTSLQQARTLRCFTLHEAQQLRSMIVHAREECMAFMRPPSPVSTMSSVSSRVSFDSMPSRGTVPSVYTASAEASLPPSATPSTPSLIVSAAESPMITPRPQYLTSAGSDELPFQAQHQRQLMMQQVKQKMQQQQAREQAQKEQASTQDRRLQQRLAHQRKASMSSVPSTPSAAAADEEELNLEETF